ncbi:viperin family antiviral radical SAM protein [Flavobacterium lacus]|uniref:S-adenosylmethionine-dependent nucleotide dehydratase n=1 Tax=Flavobacterium lacus TaxID=1353778 RepID=A0A328WJS4_9FLAO|nr:viperin family antiviral radical SAM protein [Flavobacterium lacus]RAR46473.1 radical S-adenosyl methionine domain-containing protein 2 [Flavobacterium lacus]
MITTINFHVIKACNYKCKFCYATFNDISSKGISKENQFEIIKELANSRMFKKINFAGGEPTLVPYIDEFIIYAKNLGFETSIVTNASKINYDWIKNISPYLDILALSVDSLNEISNLKSGRNQNGKTVSKDKLIELAQACRQYGVNLKINTVVSQFNKDECLTNLINELNPFRWKILQATKVEGQNEKQFDLTMISSTEFYNFCSKNKNKLNFDIKTIEEPENLIQGSYLMVDMLGRFYDSSKGSHSYSEPILKIGLKSAINQVSVNSNKFVKREGNYTIKLNQVA